MSRKNQGSKKPKLSFLGVDFDERERLDPEKFEEDSDSFRAMCPETFGKHGPINTEQELREMLASLPSSFPVVMRYEDEEVFTAGEISVDWFEVWRMSDPLYELAGFFKDDSDCNEVEALRAAHITRIAQIDWMVSGLKIAMAEAFEFLRAETFWNAIDVGRWSLTLPCVPRNKMIKDLSRQFEAALRRRNKMPEGRRAASSSNSWKQIVTAIKHHPSAVPPKLGKFAASMARFKGQDEKHARDAIKKELAKLRREGFCPETNWPKLYTGIRRGTFPSLSRIR